ncbi:uncharacterized protein NPIL_701391, partial [Nephila pilipes]
LRIFPSTKKFVEFYLVLKLLRKDLLEADKRSLTEEQRFTDERRAMTERAKSHPLDILDKEEIIHKIKLEIKDIRTRNVELDRQVTTAMSAKVKEDMTWFEIQRWINMLYRRTTEIIPLDADEPRECVVNQLQRIQDFVMIGNKVIERLNKGYDE